MSQMENNQYDKGERYSGDDVQQAIENLRRKYHDSMDDHENTVRTKNNIIKNLRGIIDDFENDLTKQFQKSQRLKEELESTKAENRKLENRLDSVGRSALVEAHAFRNMRNMINNEIDELIIEIERQESQMDNNYYFSSPVAHQQNLKVLERFKDFMERSKALSEDSISKNHLTIKDEDLPDGVVDWDRVRDSRNMRGDGDE